MRKLLWVILMLPTVAFSLQNKFIANNGTVWAPVSKSHVTRLFVQEDRIESYHSGKENFEATLTEGGELFIKPKSEEPVELFALTEKGNGINFVLNPTKAHSDHIQVILEELALAKTKPLFNANTPYSQSITQIITDLFNNRAPSDLIKKDKTKNIRFKKELSVKQQVGYLGADGESLVWRVSNKTSDTISLKPQDFYGPGVRAVAIESCKLLPHASTRVFIITGEAT
jgi:type-F conjugative transfer system secretin TraK